MAVSQAVQKDSAALSAQPEDYQKVRVPLIDGGLHTDKAAVDLALNETPSIQNLILVAGVLQVDTGYAQFGSVIEGASFFGSPQVAFQIFNTNGTDALLLITTTTVYQYVIEFSQWQLVQFGTTYTSIGEVTAGGAAITLTSVAGLGVGSHLGLPLDDGEQLPVTVTAIVGSVVAFTPPVPAGRNVPASSTVLVAITLHGSYNNQVCGVSFVSNNWFIITNGLDPIFYFDGSKLINLVTSSDLPASTTCAWMVVFHESLYLIATVENGTEFPQRVRASDLGNPLLWTPASTNIAAIYNLTDTEDFINAGDILGPYLILYRDTTIMRGTYLGLPNEIIFWEYTIYGEGTTISSGELEVGSEHMFVGNASVYLYSGGYDLDDIGDPIYIGFLSNRGNLNAAAKGTLFTQYVGDYDEGWIFYPAGTSAVPNQLLRVSFEKNSWYLRVFANSFISCAPYLALNTTTWESAAGTWAQQTRTWNSRIFQANVPIYLMCSGDDQKVYAYDYGSTTDNGIIINWSVQTKDISIGNEMFRWDSIRAYGQGTALCSFSTDGGQTFTTIGTFSFGATPSMKILTFQAVSPYIRFQLSGTDPTFELSWLEAWFLTESEW